MGLSFTLETHRSVAQSSEFTFIPPNGILQVR
jgi:hypothetical protein